jgi:DNA replication protein DnaC
MTSPSCDFREIMRQMEAKRHCSCDGLPQHGHCLDCDTHLPECEDSCAPCKERKSRERFCSECQNHFYLPAVKGEVSKPQCHGFCSEQCYEAAVKSATQKRLEIGLARVPPRYRDCTLTGFDAYSQRLVEKVRLVTSWANGELETGLYLFGGVGTGKTHLAVGAMRVLIERGFRGEFVNARSFVMQCQTAFRQKESAREIVDEILHHADFLILDDLGSEKSTEYVRQSLLHLVDECYSRQVVLVVTSNCGFEALNQLDERIASRLAEMCDRVKFDEADYRAQIAKNRLKGASRITGGGVEMVQ